MKNSQVASTSLAIFNTICLLSSFFFSPIILNTSYLIYSRFNFLSFRFSFSLFPFIIIVIIVITASVSFSRRNILSAAKKRGNRGEKNSETSDRPMIRLSALVTRQKKRNTHLEKMRNRLELESDMKSEVHAR